MQRRSSAFRSLNRYRESEPPTPIAFPDEIAVRILRLLITEMNFYTVPSCQLARYFSCSGVKTSILIPIDSSLSAATF